MRSSLLLVSSIGLFGCTATDIAVPNTAPINETVCCLSETEYPWVRLQPTQDLEFKITSSSPIGQFSTGKSYFSAFAFNDQSGDVNVLIRSNMQEKQVIIPRVDLLDNQFQLVKTIDSEEFDIVFSDVFAKNRFELKTQVNSIETPYIIIYADADSLGQKVVVPHPAIVRAKESGEPMPIVTNPTYYSSSIGQFFFSVETLTLSGTNQKQPLSNNAELTNAETKNTNISALPETKNYYFTEIEKSVKANDISKALALLEEAKALNVEGAQEAFIKAVNSK